MDKIFRFGDKIKVNTGGFKGVVGELVGIDWGSQHEIGNPSIASLRVDNDNIIKVDIRDIEVIDDFPNKLEVINKENGTKIILQANHGTWNESLNKEFPICFSIVDLDNDDNRMVSELSINKLIELEETIHKIVEYSKSKKQKYLEMCGRRYGIVGTKTPFKYTNADNVYVGDVVKITDRKSSHSATSVIVCDSDTNKFEIMGAYGDMDNEEYIINGWDIELVRNHNELEVGEEIRCLEVREEYSLKS